MICPHCQTQDMRVYETRHSSWFDLLAVTRHRQCLRCGHTWRTVELPEDQLLTLHQDSSALNTIRRTLK